MIRRLLLISFAFTLLAAWPAAAQKQKQSQQKQADVKDDTPLIQSSDEQAVDTAITEMLGAWQIGDVEMLRKYFADNVLVVSGMWEPPIMGVDNYIKAYQRQRERVRGVQFNRSNSFVRVNGNVAWAVYQWTFTGEVDGQPAGYHGHTTLVFEKHNGRWLIITNHTSYANPPAPAAAPAQQAPAPAKP